MMLTIKNLNNGQHIFDHIFDELILNETFSPEDNYIPSTMDHMDAIFSLFEQRHIEVRTIKINYPNKSEETFDVLTNQGHFSISYKQGEYMEVLS